MKRRLLLALPCLVVLYGALLRLDAITMKYGAVTSPAWLHAVQVYAAPPLRFLRPATVSWEPMPLFPHSDGSPTHYYSDPYSYLKRAREMRSFYEAHFFEPLFPFVTHVSLHLLNNQDVAVSFASASFSVLTILATYLLGTAAFGYWAGLGAALAMAIEYDVVSLGTSGWGRDEAFTFSAVITAFALLQYSRAPSRMKAIAVGVCAGMAYLVRITSLTFLVPSFLYLLLATKCAWRERLAEMGIAVATMAIVVGPYVFDCWRTFGDPIYSVNYQTANYQIAEGQAPDARPTALSYVGRKLVVQPFRTLDTVVLGLTSYPFTNKWQGFDVWTPALGTALSWASIVGLILFVGSPVGRLLLLVLFGSLVTFSATWPLIHDWRFTEFAYPFLLLASFAALARGLCLLGSAVTGKLRLADLVPDKRRLVFWSTVLASITAGTWIVLRLLPVLTFRESLVTDKTAVAMAGDRDGAFFGSGWSRTFTQDNVTARVSFAPSSIVWLPLPRSEDYDLTIRVDPFPRPPDDDVGPMPKVSVLANGTLVGAVTLTWNPVRVGSYDVRIPRSLVRPGFNRLVFVGTGTAGRTFMLWYVLARVAS